MSIGLGFPSSAGLALENSRLHWCDAWTRRRLTGSCGKTSAVHLIKNVVSLAGSCHAAAGNNYVHTTSHTVYSLERSRKYCIQEISAHEKGDVAQHVRVLKPQIGVVTVIGTDHANPRAGCHLWLIRRSRGPGNRCLQRLAGAPRTYRRLRWRDSARADTIGGRALDALCCQERACRRHQ
jgi:hypothetical protein